ncbi:transposase [Paenibacillus cymbidii]|uniref:transposase n=1 Tax=Paenibacillus cymbidii TaxID=1639034 RepID=UPI001081CC56|nr:transposase [Paenibacillus cymbidii]
MQHITVPVSLQLDAALSREQFDQQFPTETACIDYLVQLRWPDGYACLRCESKHYTRLETRRLPLFVCRDCRYQASPIVGSVMEGSRTQLRIWFLIYFLSSQSAFRMNALAISRQARVTYKTAWLILMKLRQAIAGCDAQTPLSGSVTVNNGFASERDHYSNQTDRQDAPVLMGGSWDASGSLNHLKIKLVSKEHMLEKRVLSEGVADFTQRHAAPEAIVSSVNARFTARWIKRLLPYFEQAIQWLHFTYGSIGKRHLQLYLDEVCYRLCNTYRGESCFAPFVRLCSKSKPTPYASIVA